MIDRYHMLMWRRWRKRNQNVRLIVHDGFNNSNCSSVFGRREQTSPTASDDYATYLAYSPPPMMMTRVGTDNLSYYHTYDHAIL